MTGESITCGDHAGAPVGWMRARAGRVAAAALASVLLATCLDGCVGLPSARESPPPRAAADRPISPRRPEVPEAETARLQPATMQLGSTVPAPLGFLRFCATWPDQCGLVAAGETSEARDRNLTARYYWNVVFRRPTELTQPEPAAAMSGRAGPLTLTPQTQSLINAVNLRVNHQIRYAPDEVAYGRSDVWALPLASGGSGLGDCKDYVLEKRRALLAAGVPAQDLAIAIVRTPWGRIHSVLLVMTTSGELVLDSLTSWIRPWHDVHYAWLERQAPGREFAWVRVGDFRER